MIGCKEVASWLCRRLQEATMDSGLGRVQVHHALWSAYSFRQTFQEDSWHDVTIWHCVLGSYGCFYASGGALRDIILGRPWGLATNPFTPVYVSIGCGLAFASPNDFIYRSLQTPRHPIRLLVLLGDTLDFSGFYCSSYELVRALHPSSPAAPFAVALLSSQAGTIVRCMEQRSRKMSPELEFVRPSGVIQKVTGFLFAYVWFRAVMGPHRARRSLSYVCLSATLLSEFAGFVNPFELLCNTALAMLRRLLRALRLGPPPSLTAKHDAARCFVFDFDDTLVLSEDCKSQLFVDMAIELCGEHGREWMVEAKKAGDRYRIWSEFARLSGRSDGDRLAELYSTRVLELVAACPEVEGASLCLRSLRRKGAHVYVNSATPHADILAVLQQRGGDWSLPAADGGFFDAAWGSGTDGGSKVENLKKAAASSGAATPLQMVMVGDGTNDRRAALDFGCHFVGIDAGRLSTSEVRWFCRDLREAQPVLEAFSRGEVPLPIPTLTSQTPMAPMAHIS